jgi:hypothetical protein
MAGLLEYTKNGQVTEPPLYRFMRGNVQSFLNSIPDPSKMTPEQQLAMGLNANPIMGLLGTTAYHGSPYLFDKFDLSKVGTGQGAQSYGHGIYFAENPQVAKRYTESTAMVSPRLRMAYDEAGGDWAKTQQIAEEKAKTDPTWQNIPLEAKSLAKGSLYKVDIPESNIPKMLDWDKPLSQQNLPLDNLLKQYKGDRLGRLTAYSKNENVPASSFYRALSEELGSDIKATKALQKAGIPGIKYLDEGSRELGQGTSNFVVFDPEQVKILEKGLLSK